MAKAKILALTESSKNKIADFLNGIQHNPQGNAVQQPPAMKQSLMPSVTAAQSQTQTTDEYNGYFKLVDVSDGGNMKIAIVDGASYNGETCNPSIAVLDGVAKEFQYQELTVTGNRYIVLEYVWHDKSSSIKAVSNIPASDDSIKYIQLGTVIYHAASEETGAYIEITQIHSSGAISFSFNYNGNFKLYRKVSYDDAGEPSFSFHMKGGLIDAGNQTVSDQDISFDGNVYVNIHYAVSGTSGTYSFNVKNTADAPSENDRVVPVLIGSKEQYTVSQFHSGNIRLAGDYII